MADLVQLGVVLYVTIIIREINQIYLELESIYLFFLRKNSNLL